MNAYEIANKYVHGLHDALTDSQEKKDMTEDIKQYARQVAIRVKQECASTAQNRALLLIDTEQFL